MGQKSTFIVAPVKSRPVLIHPRLTGLTERGGLSKIPAAVGCVRTTLPDLHS